jgi:hypothetical protein
VGAHPVGQGEPVPVAGPLGDLAHDECGAGGLPVRPVDTELDAAPVTLSLGVAEARAAAHLEIEQ